MSVLTQLVGSAAAAHTLEHGGKVYSCRLIDDAVHAEWEKRQLARAKDFERVFKDMLTTDEFRERLDRLAARYHAGDYSLLKWFVLHAAAFQAAATAAHARPDGQLDTAAALALMENNRELADGMFLLGQLIFQCSATEMQKLMLERQAEVSSLLGLIIKESLPTETAAGASNTASEGAAPNR